MRNVLLVLIVYFEERLRADWLIDKLGNLKLLDHKGLFHTIIIYDNSPNSLSSDSVPSGIKYKSDTDNGGLRAAYLFASEQCSVMNLNHLIFIDQDTEITADYVSEIHKTCLSSNMIYVPSIYDGYNLVSPSFVSKYGGMTIAKTNNTLYITAISSGTVYPNQFLKAVGPIPKELWLDYLDHWLFYKAKTMGIVIEKLDSTLHHSLSVQRIRGINKKRFLNFSNEILVKVFILLRIYRYFALSLSE